MSLNSEKESSLISVIITCYNHGQYLARAIESVLKQNYQNFEIIVVDDGSTDNTAQISENYTDVKYVYQSNQGLSAARNTGIDHSSGVYISFLDADDWFLPGALSANLTYLMQNPELAFVSGGYVRINEQNEITNKTTHVVDKDHYCHLLRAGNFIVMHAAVLYRRRVFDEFRFDVSLKACEDYDIYLKIAGKYPILHHTKFIAAYRTHTQNMSGDVPLMLESALLVLNRRREFLSTSKEREFFQKGLKFWKDLYCNEVYYNLLYKPDYAAKNVRGKEIDMLRRFRKQLYFKYLVLKPFPLMQIKDFVRKNFPHSLQRILHKAGLIKSFIHPHGKIKFGDLDRTVPFNYDFGYSRGGPVDRYYIENFLQRQSNKIKGRVLEIGDNEYTTRFGGAQVTKSDILHINKSNPNATLIGDLSNAPHLPTASFDCIILTQTLHLIYNFRDALQNCCRILKPGGALLITVPGISQIDQGEWNQYWMWSFTENSMRKLLTENFPLENVLVETFGNVFAATAFLYGIGSPEVKKERLDYSDPHYPVIITAAAVKSE